MNIKELHKIHQYLRSIRFDFLINKELSTDEQVVIDIINNNGRTIAKLFTEKELVNHESKYIMEVEFDSYIDAIEYYSDHEKELLMLLVGSENERLTKAQTHVEKSITKLLRGSDDESSTLDRLKEKILPFKGEYMILGKYFIYTL